MIDLHTHVLPGLDDGTRSLAEARELALEAAEDGVTALAATPHVRDDWPTTPDTMEDAVAELREDFARHGVPMQVLHGAEVALDLLWAIPPEDLPRLTIAQTGRYLLLEVPYRGWPFAFESAVMRLLELGVTPLLAHPERNPEVQDRPDRVRGVVEAGALVQVTAASIEGSRDRAAQAAARRLLDLGFVHVIASDSHGPHIARQGMAEAAAALDDPVLARYLTVDVPGAIAAGEPVPARPQVGLGA
ncbi:MAG TPA: CpsB/CapC family capsule biosynthesis tyrosine phosphatase [Gaiellaceae bacterium]|nr:CpsB/CapC family capsule biosynthesis tyrosine phosphatase [Gaiellaceae bacterium]